MVQDDKLENLAAISQIYNLLDTPEDVYKFLSRYEYLIDPLLDAPVHIKSIFGDCPLDLEYVQDSDGELECLFLVIHSQVGAEEASQLERKLLQSDWFSRLSDKVKCILEIATLPKVHL